jgi:hypothetical protein
MFILFAPKSLNATQTNLPYQALVIPVVQHHQHSKGLEKYVMISVEAKVNCSLLQIKSLINLM